MERKFLVLATRELILKSLTGLLVAASLSACGGEIPADSDSQQTSTSGSTQVTETAPPASSETSAQASNSDGVLDAIQGNFRSTLTREVDGQTKSQTFDFTIGKRKIENTDWPIISISSTGELGTIDLGAYLAWELYGYGTTYALVTPAMNIPAISDDFTVAFELILTIQSGANGAKTLVPTQSAILIKDCGYFDGVFASCSTTLREAAFSGNSFEIR